MDMIISLLIVSTLPQLVVPQATSATSFRAIAELVSGDARIFSGESVRVRCSVPSGQRSTWDFLWFRGSEQLPQHGQDLILWGAHVKESGKISCQGVRDTVVGNLYTLHSLPVEINVDGGWAILHVPPQPGLVGNTLKVTCRVRGTPRLHEVILYKDGFEVMRQKGHNPQFYLNNLTTEDQGMYSCRASWDIGRSTRSVVSADSQVQVLEVVSQPVLEIDSNSNLISANMMRLICHHQYNAPAPAPPVHYYFYKNNDQIGTATSENYDLVRHSPGQYSCRVKVPELGIVRWSEPENFGEGPQTTMHPIVHPRDPWPVAPPLSFPDLSLPPANEPTATHPSIHQSTATPFFIQPSEMSTQTSGPIPSQPAPNNLLPVQSLNQIAVPETVDTSEESGDMSGESGDMPEGSSDMPEEYDDEPDRYDDMPEQSGDMPEQSGDMPEQSGDMPEQSGDMPEQSGDMY